MKKNASHHESPAVSAEERYLSSLSSFSRTYWFLVACVGVIVLFSVVVAIVWQISLGLLSGIAGAVLYEYFKRDAFRTHLGMRVKIENGGLSVTSLHAKGKEMLYLPEALVGWQIRELGEGAMGAKRNENLTVLYLPASLRRIEKGAFDGCPALSEIRFAGSRDAFEKIACDADLSGITLSFGVKYPKKESDQKTPPCEESTQRNED